MRKLLKKLFKNYKKESLYRFCWLYGDGGTYLYDIDLKTGKTVRI
jgi:hypothetical protein